MVAFSGASILGIVIALLVIFVLIFNTIYISGVRAELNRSGTTLNLSKTGADIIFWTDIILIILTGFYLIYNIWRIFTTPEQRTVVTQLLTTSQANTGGLPIPVRA